MSQGTPFPDQKNEDPGQSWDTNCWKSAAETLPQEFEGTADSNNIQTPTSSKCNIVPFYTDRFMDTCTLLTGTSQLEWRWSWTPGLSLRSSSADPTPRCVMERKVNNVQVDTFGFIPLQNEHKRDMRNQVSYYSTDQQALRKILTDADVVDWSRYFIIGG